jgi:iron complex transport system substrate-binding protein
MPAGDLAIFAGVAAANNPSSHQVDAVGASRVVVLDGPAYFNRPGPRLVDSLELVLASRQV